MFVLSSAFLISLLFFFLFVFSHLLSPFLISFWVQTLQKAVVRLTVHLYPYLSFIFFFFLARFFTCLAQIVRFPMLVDAWFWKMQFPAKPLSNLNRTSSNINHTQMWFGSICRIHCSNVLFHFRRLFPFAFFFPNSPRLKTQLIKALDWIETVEFAIQTVMLCDWSWFIIIINWKFKNVFFKLWNLN